MIELIPTGAENAILLKDLAALTGKAPRTVQADIMRLRDEGEPILSSASGGYYLPTNDDEGFRDVSRYIEMMKSQAYGRLKRLRAANRWIIEYRQTQLKELGGK
jgi:biotin operon repressor